MGTLRKWLALWLILFLTAAPFAQQRRAPSITPAPVNFAASGDNTVSAAVAGQSLCVYGLFIVNTGATVITIKDGATAVTGPMSLAANQQLFWELREPKTGEPWFVTSSGNAFVINSSNAVQVSGSVYAQPCV